MGDTAEHIPLFPLSTPDTSAEKQHSQDRSQQIEVEQTRLLYAQAPSAVVISLFNATILVFFLRHEVPSSALIAWWTGMLGAYLIRSLLVWRYRQATLQGTPSQHWRTRFLISAVLSGCAWGSCALLLFPTVSLPHQLLLAFVVGGMAIGAIASMAAVRAAYIGFILPLTLPLVWRFFLQGGDDAIAMGSLSFIFVGGLLVMASQFHTTITESIALRFEKQDLLQSRKALQLSHDVLEDRVRERTMALQQEVRERARSETHARAMLQAIPDTVFRVNRDGVLLDFTPRDQFSALPAPESVVGKSVTEIVPPDVARAVNGAVAEALRTGTAQICEYPLSLQGTLHNYEIRLVVSGPDEVVGIVRDITQRKEVERLKDEFISTVSHELRTPLTSLVGFTELMLNRQFSPEKQQQYVSLIHDESVCLAHLVNDLLDLQRMQLGNLTYHLAALDLEPLLKTCGALFERDASSLRFAIASPLLPVYADDARIRQVVTNLLSNAIKFSPADGIVTVGAEVQHDEVVTWIADQGPGIPADALPKLFDKFFRVDNKETRHIGGAGLGLALVKEIVTAHGGRVWVESTLGQGSTFFFTLPLVSAVSDAVADSLAEVR
ncbi:MAG: PAS domain S-box protein [Deltaproteobacteria bacterium]|nr:PAS domain S-box protein [Deltaproteobacteria bacterium]